MTRREETPETLLRLSQLHLHLHTPSQTHTCPQSHFLLSVLTAVNVGGEQELRHVPPSEWILQDPHRASVLLRFFIFFYRISFDGVEF